MIKYDSWDLMDALILCGGFAKRLEPITLFVPKPLLPIGGRPILDHIVEGLEKTKVNRIIISTNKKFGNQFEYWSGMKTASGFKKRLELVIEPPVENNSKLGAIKGIQYAIDKAGIHDDLLIIAGDNFYDADISHAIDYFERSGRHPTICVHDVGSAEEAKKFGVVEIDGDNRIEGFEEKPENPKSTLASTAIYIYPKEVLSKFREYLTLKNNPDAPGYFTQWLLRNTEVHAFKNRGRWFDIGTIETYSRVCSLFEHDEKS